jgi:NAD+ kinase
MIPMVRKVAILYKGCNPKTRECLQMLISELSFRKIEVFLYSRNEDEVAPYREETISGLFSSLSEFTVKPDLIFSVGGDGTFLETAMVVGDTGIPIAGINTGRMGFLANIPNENIKQSVDLLCNEDFYVVNRSLLEIVRPENIFGIDRALALNEVTIQKTGFSMLNIHVYVNDEFLNTYWADGIIISTATGSTAYNLSVGGPILSPDDDSIVISPISPHHLTVRPLVLSGRNNLKIGIEGRVKEYLATCDFRSKNMRINEEIHIHIPDFKLKTVMLKKMTFFNTLRNRLMWGMDKRN